MKQTDLSRRAFLLGLGAVSSAALLSACNTNAPVNSGPTPSQPESEPAANPDASSEVTREPILTADEFPMTDGSTACIPLIAQIMADTTGMDLETAQSCVSTNTTAWAWRNAGWARRSRDGRARSSRCPRRSAGCWSPARTARRCATT